MGDHDQGAGPVVQEILQDKIFLDMSNELKTVADLGPMSAGPPEFDFASL